MKTTVHELANTRETAAFKPAPAPGKCAEKNRAKYVHGVPILLLEGKKKGLVTFR